MVPGAARPSATAASTSAAIAAARRPRGRNSVLTVEPKSGR